MKAVYQKLLLRAVASLGIGSVGIVPVINSDNGYVAGYVFFPILFLISIVAFILFFAGLVTITKKVGPFLLLSSILLPAGFIFTGIVAKHFELGAYRIEPMSPIIPTIANKVIFKEGTTQDDVHKFWSEVLSERVGSTGEKTRPGIQSISSNIPENGLEVITFSFFQNATDDEKADVKARIKAYEPVLQYLENVSTNSTREPGTDSSDTKKAVNVRQPIKGKLDNLAR